DIYGLKQLRELIFEEGTSPELEKIEISGCTLESGIIGVNQLPKLKEISLGSYGRVAKLAMLQSEVDAHPNSPVLRLQMPKRYHDVESAAAGELSRSQAVAMVTTNVNQDDLLYNYNSC
uniref:Uncharacterized protein n=2 Tax=Triticum urartu TaxID=4572 RepID=A0A8R7QZJ1_TRIUA